MDLSVVILSYNVKYLLDACIHSVLHATQSILAEIIVVDNASTDESVTLVREKYPDIRIIENEINVGFSKANNAGVRAAHGNYVLILNPDTVVNESAIIGALRHLQNQAETGIAGVRMHDARGQYLPESKRGFPDLISSFFKITGIYRFFPKSDFFNHYYLGSKDKTQLCNVEVLTGAFMMMPKSLYEEVGGFDESYFMYGEDIDLSNKIKKSGKNLVYLGNEQIIHLKGRSARFDSYQHVKNFYQAMSIFVNKNYSNRIARWIIHLAIAAAGGLSFINRKIISHIIPLIDFVFILSTIAIVKYFWGYYWFADRHYFDHRIFYANAAGYILIWMLSLFFFNTYHPLHLRDAENTLKATWIGTLAILIIYSLLPEQLRSSRSVILFTALLLTLLLPLYRKWISTTPTARRALFFGTNAQEKEFRELFHSLNYSNQFSYFSNSPADLNLVAIKCKEENISTVVLDPSQYTTDSLLKVYGAVPNKTDVMYLQSINNITTISDGNLALASTQNKVLKWMANLMLSLFLIPFGWWHKQVRENYLTILSGKKYWVGYESPIQENLPFRKIGVWSLKDDLTVSVSSMNYNLEYARVYSVMKDLRMVINQLF
ncbi:MAG: glycosyltransferase family 2 protein [Saprospiraceae bacterium]|nr:glycosyltransferase family 2 protein [Saprospiraceae bacterium]